MSTADSVAWPCRSRPTCSCWPSPRDGTFKAKPQVTLADKTAFGRLSGLDLVSPTGWPSPAPPQGRGTPVSSDDRALVITPGGGGGAGPD